MLDELDPTGCDPAANGLRSVVNQADALGDGELLDPEEVARGIRDEIADGDDEEVVS